MKKEHLIYFLMVPLIFMVANGCTRKAHDNDTLYFNLSTEPPTLDPTLSTDTTSSLVIRNIFDGLLDYDVTKLEMPIVPKVAKSWTISRDGRIYTFQLRDDVYWSDGKKVTAHDFEYSWKRLITPATASEYAYFLFDVKNAKAFNSGEIKDISKVGIKALSDTTFQITLGQPVAYFLHIPTFAVLSPVRQDVIEKFGDKWTEPENIVTNGPFKLTKWKHDYELILDRNENYFDTQAKLKRVHCYMVVEASTALSLYQTKKLDVIRDDLPPPDIPTLKKSPEFHSGNYFSVYYIGLNTKKPPLNDINVRKALISAVDRQEVVQALGDYGQLPTNSLIPKNLLGYNPNIGIGFNTATSQKWLEKAGFVQKKTTNSSVWIHQKTKLPFPTVSLMFNTNEGHKTLAENLQAQWQKTLGIPVEINNQEWKVYLKTLQTADKDMSNAPFHMYRLGWVADYPDPDNFVSIFTSYSVVFKRVRHIS